MFATKHCLILGHVNEIYVEREIRRKAKRDQEMMQQEKEATALRNAGGHLDPKDKKMLNPKDKKRGGKKSKKSKKSKVAANLEFDNPVSSFEAES